jgi:hypothetical protein
MIANQLLGEIDRKADPRGGAKRSRPDRLERKHDKSQPKKHGDVHCGEGGRCAKY